MERYDAAVIGAGPDGLIAAHRLARAGLKVVVLERAKASGGRAATHEFYPGFRASPFADELAALPQRLFRSLDPARHGAVLMDAPASVCLSGGEASILYTDEKRLARSAGAAAPALIALRRELAAAREAIAARALTVDARRSHWPDWLRRERRPRWPGEEWSALSLDEALRHRISDGRLRLHLAAAVTSGRAVSPFLSGTALHLLAAGSGTAPGGLAALGAALDLAARAAGAFIRCDAEVADIVVEQGRAAKVVLAGGEEIFARAVLSTLDVKHTFLNLIAWKKLPEELIKRVARFRTGGSAARVLLALDTIPDFPFARAARDAALAPIHVVHSLEAMSQAHDSWRAGQLGEKLPITLRVPSLADPRLAPPGKAVMTATISAVPSVLFDGEWSVAKRARLVAAVLAAAEQAARGLGKTVLGAHTIVASDVEGALGLTDGDFDGGEVVPDQIFGFRPFPEWRRGRTPVRGLYLGGPSAGPAPFLLGVAGERAALALIADRGSEHRA